MASSVLFGLFAVGQKNTKPDDFHWDPHNAQELTSKQEISRLQIRSIQKTDIVETIVEQLREDGPSTGPQTPKHLRTIALETRITFVDLSGHGDNEIIAQGGGEELCSPTGNCPLWILQRQRDGYHIILDANSVQTFTIHPTKTNGLKDLVLAMHGSATDAGLTLYKFNGSSYHDVACYDANWEPIDQHREAHHTKEPRITPCR